MYVRFKQHKNLTFQPGLTQTRLYSHRGWLEARSFGLRKYRNCTIHVAKTKAMISLTVTAKLICAFVFAYADCWLSRAAAQMVSYVCLMCNLTYFVGGELVLLESFPLYILRSSIFQLPIGEFKFWKYKNITNVQKKSVL